MFLRAVSGEHVLIIAHYDVIRLPSNLSSRRVIFAAYFAVIKLNNRRILLNGLVHGTRGVGLRD